MNDSSPPAADPKKVALRVAFGDFGHWEESIRRNLAARYEPAFVDLSRARLSDFDAVIPLQIRHYSPLARHPELRGSKFFSPSRAAVSLCDDKLKLARLLIKHGFANVVPRLRSPGPPYPYVWKKRRSWWGKDCHIVKGPEDERSLRLRDRAYFAQEFVPGEVEFATHILLVAGRIRYASTFAHTMGTPFFVNGAQDTPVQSTFFPGCDYLDIFSRILEQLQFEGTACIDYKIAGGQPVLFEINPRFGGSLCSDITAYLDAYIGSLTPQSPAHGFKERLTDIPSRLVARFR
jgi:hypothetical protein